MNDKKIVIWDYEDILSSSIKFFLAAKQDWQVVSITEKEGVDAFFQAVKTTQPDIVIIRQGSCNGLTDLPLRILRDYPAIKVIVVNLNDNFMRIYGKKTIVVNQVSDLIGFIENGA